MTYSGSSFFFDIYGKYGIIGTNSRLYKHSNFLCYDTTKIGNAINYYKSSSTTQFTAGL